MKTHHPRKKKPKSFPSIIRLAGTPEEWANIPLKIVRSIRTDKLPRLKRIHQSISNAANLLMPPVEIVPWGWTTPDNKGMVYGRCELLRVESGYDFGAEISVATLLFVDDLLLRRILIHEFSHCFWYNEQVLLSAAKGKRELRGSTPTDLSIEELYDRSKSGGDEETRVNPFEWFSEQDAKQFLDYDESVLNPSTFAFLRHWVSEGLPICTPNVGTNDFQGRLGIPEHIIRHVRKLRGEAVETSNQLFTLPEDETE